ncbi:bifunctional adenosylcobinamide kinase/adenosylcobinamide-phosphate guanylyltransferase [Entomomonas sp. E2T0]|uniref:bifunctional adenosylcobinamide kinase/adenosylcobinamide-phosphate guanylyltransferase n=1 Tax=Entomomonas sp. E2T0 TaxID=2930213 RepID=UPI0022283A92|nr:bifunctional adenosylcobinamide kinase/adenosylcobinamide-phosphate guanylyltransferase [Entomomonas sp. E2T0]UYZ82688.1 bifunctional adenosylcobinamide kinase/adenosylcobinamide-phosphate guanylyltransferase [Entomomonas sp. E2T0]
MKKITLVTGGQRSGKSSFAEKLALSLSANPIYIATSRIWDEEYRQRIERHQLARGDQWTNIEEEKKLSQHDVTNKVVLVDCVTLWATNYFFDLDSAIEQALIELKQEFALFTQQNAQFIFVTNEIGLGGTPENTLQRKFTDLLGWLNQYIAQQADEVYFTVAGIPMKIKG